MTREPNHRRQRTPESVLFAYCVVGGEPLLLSVRLSGSHIMKYCLVVLSLFITNVFGEGAYPKNLADNIRVHLAGARMVPHPTLGQTERLFARFQGDDERSRNILREVFSRGPNPNMNATTGDFLVEFSSRPHSAHEATLINVIRSCISWKKRDTDRGQKWPPTGWDLVRFDLVLSVPPPKEGAVVDWDQWVILTLSERKANESAGTDRFAAPLVRQHE